MKGTEKKTAPWEQEAVGRITTNNVKLIEVIEVKTTYGAGTAENPYRIATEYWSKEGELLAVRDSVA